MDAPPAPVNGFGELMGKPVRRAACVAEDDVVWNSVDRFATFGSDHDLSVGIACLEIVSGPDVLAGLLDGIGVTDHADARFDIVKALDVSFEVGVAKVVVEHPTGTSRSRYWASWEE